MVIGNIMMIGNIIETGKSMNFEIMFANYLVHYMKYKDA